MNKEQFKIEKNLPGTKKDESWERYFDISHKKNKQIMNRFNWMVDRMHGPSLLDIGCSGGLGMFLASKKDGIDNIFGIDVSEEAVRISKERNPCATVECGLAEELSFKDSSFDCVILGETLEHVVDADAVVREAYRVLRNGGTIVITVPEGGRTSREHLRVFTEDTISFLLIKSGFVINEIDRMESGHTSSPLWILIKATK